MPRWGAIILGLATALPVAYAVIFVAHVMSLQPGVQPPPFPLGKKVDWHLAAMALTTVLLVIYVVAALTLRQVPKSKRVLWVVLLFIGSFFAFPFFGTYTFGAMIDLMTLKPSNHPGHADALARAGYWAR